MWQVARQHCCDRHLKMSAAAMLPCHLSHFNTSPTIIHFTRSSNILRPYRILQCSPYRQGSNQHSTCVTKCVNWTDWIQQSWRLGAVPLTNSMLTISPKWTVGSIFFGGFSVSQIHSSPSITNLKALSSFSEQTMHASCTRNRSKVSSSRLRLRNASSLLFRFTNPSERLRAIH